MVQCCCRVLLYCICIVTWIQYLFCSVAPYRAGAHRAPRFPAPSSPARAPVALGKGLVWSSPCCPRKVPGQPSSHCQENCCTHAYYSYGGSDALLLLSSSSTTDASCSEQTTGMYVFYLLSLFSTFIPYNNSIMMQYQNKNDDTVS